MHDCLHLQNTFCTKLLKKRKVEQDVFKAECDVPVLGFVHFVGCIGTTPVSEKFGTGIGTIVKKSLTTGLKKGLEPLVKKWYYKSLRTSVKVLELVSKKFGLSLKTFPLDLFQTTSPFVSFPDITTSFCCLFGPQYRSRKQFRTEKFPNQSR